MRSENPEYGRGTARGRPRPAGGKRAQAEDRRSAREVTPAYRPPSMHGAHPMVSALQSAINPMVSATKIRESLALAYWTRVAGPQAAAASEADCVRDGVLFVRTKSSVWSHELMLYKTRLLLGLNRLLGDKIITDIVFRAQGVRRAESEAEPDMPAPEELAAVVLEPEEKTELRARLHALITIKEDPVRRAIASRLTQEAKLRHWRLEHGWRVCPRCDAIHKTDYRLCPICRLSK